jgi:iron-sulfur cluster assembly accessory protein
LLIISDKAAEIAMAILEKEDKNKWGIRIYVAGSGCCGPTYGLNLQEEQMPSDEVIKKNGLKVFVNKELLQSLSGMKLDYYKDENSEGFIFTGSTPSCSSSSCNSCG